MSFVKGYRNFLRKEDHKQLHAPSRPLDFGQKESPFLSEPRSRSTSSGSSPSVFASTIKSSLTLNVFIAPSVGSGAALPYCFPYIRRNRHVHAWPISGQGLGIAIGTQQPGNICPTKNILFVLPAVFTLLSHWFSLFVLVLLAQASHH